MSLGSQVNIIKMSLRGLNTDGFITHYIIDDMIGTNIFKNGRSLLTNLCIRKRHITPSNIIISTQSMMMIPKTIRFSANLYGYGHSGRP
jgi:hypothetical protein